MGVEESIEKHTLANAIRYKGKASMGAVISKVLGDCPEAKQDMKNLSQQIQTIIQKINALDVEEQNKQLSEKYPEMLEEKPKKERDLFSFFDIKEGEKVVSAFVPEPSKYPHIGHAKAALLNYELAKKHNGKFLLRFEDTNPELAKKEFYDIILDNCKWLGLKWDSVLYASDMIDELYEQAEKLIQKGLAYICSCPSEKIKECRMKAEGCEHRDQSVDETLAKWKEMFKSEPGSYILRAKVSVDHKNTAMRDPALFRINNTPHCRTGTKYIVWPMYDFQNPIADALSGVTHRLRSKEFELRAELHRWLQEKLGFPITKIYEMARFNLKGVEASGRVIREKIANGEFTGWDDPRLTTLVALRRRGFVPEGIKNFIFNTGITKTESTLTWDDLETQNRRVLDKEANRYFFINKHVKVEIQNAPEKEIELDLHPDRKNGGRKFKTNTEFYLTEKDVNKLEDGKLYRLMDCLNFVKKESGYFYEEGGITEYRGKGAGILHWLPVDEHQIISVKVIKPDQSSVSGFAEGSVKSVEIGSVVQFTRFGFCRLDEKNVFWYTHH